MISNPKLHPDATYKTNSSIVSTIYNCIQMPPTPKCCVCNNQQVQKQFQRIEKQSYIQMPDRYVKVFVCDFCKKIDQPKCEHCWNSNPCCSHKKERLWEEFYKTTKQDIIKTTQSIFETYRYYEARSAEELTFPMNTLTSPESINKQLTISLYDVQSKLKKEIQEAMHQNYKEIFEVYKKFETDLNIKLHPSSPEGVHRLQKDVKEIGLKDKLMKKISLPDCVKWLKEIQNHKISIDHLARSVCDSYFQKINRQYPNILYHRLKETFRTILMPKVSYKQALIQTTELPGSSSSIHSQKSIHEQKQEVAAANIEQKVDGMKKVIEKNLETIHRLEDRIKDLEEIVDIQQTKNQELEFKVIELETKCGIQRKEQDESLNEDPFIESNPKMILKPTMKSSKSNPDLLNQSDIIDLHLKRQKDEKKFQQIIDKSNNEMKQPQSEVKPQQKISRPRKQSEGKKATKDKSLLQNSSWLQEVVSEIKE